MATFDDSMIKLDLYTNQVLDYIWKELIVESKKESHNIYLQKKHQHELNELCITLALKIQLQNTV